MIKGNDSYKLSNYLEVRPAPLVSLVAYKTLLFYITEPVKSIMYRYQNHLHQKETAIGLITQTGR